MKVTLGKWRTNARKQDVGVKKFTKGLLEGRPRPTEECSYEQMVRDGLVGLYEKPGPVERRRGKGKVGK